MLSDYKKTSYDSVVWIEDICGIRFGIFPQNGVLPVGLLNGVPVYLIAKERPNRSIPGSVVVSFKCPCGRTHEHGMEKDFDPHQPTHRMAHCNSMHRRSGYYIVRKMKSDHSD